MREIFPHRETFLHRITRPGKKPTALVAFFVTWAFAFSLVNANPPGAHGADPTPTQLNSIGSTIVTPEGSTLTYEGYTKEGPGLPSLAPVDSDGLPALAPGSTRVCYRLTDQDRIYPRDVISHYIGVRPAGYVVTKDLMVEVQVQFRYCVETQSTHPPISIDYVIAPDFVQGMWVVDEEGQIHCDEPGGFQHVKLDPWIGDGSTSWAGDQKNAECTGGDDGKDRSGSTSWNPTPKRMYKRWPTWNSSCTIALKWENDHGCLWPLGSDKLHGVLKPFNWMLP